MFQSLKRLFRKEEKPAAPAARPAQPFAKPAAAPQVTPVAEPPQPPQTPTPAAPVAPQPATAPLEGPTVSIPFGKILNHLPQSLKARVRQAHTSKTQANLPLALLVPQLMKGRVEVTFAQLRQALPPGALGEETDLDGSKFEIPLAELLPLIPPHLLPRRTSQKTIEIPDEVAPVFGQAGNEIRVAQKSTPVTPTPAAPPPPAPPSTPAPAPVPTQIQLPTTPVKAPYRETPAATPTPTPPPSDSGPIRMNAGDLQKLSQPKPSTPTPAPSTPAIKPVSTTSTETSISSPKLPGTTTRPETPAPTPTQTTAPAPSSSPGTVAIPVSQVIDSLPDAIKGSLSQAKTQNASFNLPAADLEKGLKSGKVVFSWKTLRTSLQPATMSSTTPAADQIEVTLPLHIVAPLFLATHKPAAPQKKVAIAQDIPDVFANRQVAAEKPAAQETPAPAAPSPAPTTAVTPTPSPTPKSEPSIPIPVPASPPPKPVQAPVTQSIGDIFGQTGRTNWTPAEIAQNTTTLPGVSGAIVALPDGLLVAAKLAPGLDPDTIAAFLPQMYGRTSQYTKELKLGDPKKITFIVDDMPLRIYRGSGVFFGVFGQNGETLPNPQLDVIAAQLGA